MNRRSEPEKLHIYFRMEKNFSCHAKMLCKLDLLTTKGLRTEIKISRSASILSTAFLRIISAFLRTCCKCKYTINSDPTPFLVRVEKQTSMGQSTRRTTTETKGLQTCTPAQTFCLKFHLFRLHN